MMTLSPLACRVFSMCLIIGASGARLISDARGKGSRMEGYVSGDGRDDGTALGEREKGVMFQLEMGRFIGGNSQDTRCAMGNLV